MANLVRNNGCSGGRGGGGCQLSMTVSASNNQICHTVIMPIDQIVMTDSILIFIIIVM